MGEYSRARSTRRTTAPLVFRAVLGQDDALDLAVAAERDDRSRPIEGVSLTYMS